MEGAERGLLHVSEYLISNDSLHNNVISQDNR